MPQRGELKGLGARPLVMGILNVTPDSFSDGGKYFDPQKALEHAEIMVGAGADIIDIGGESTRPGSESVSVQEELDRVMPVIEMLNREEEIAVSIDTIKPDVAKAALDAGAVMINDISALGQDNKLADLATQYGAYLVLMHMRGTPQNMQDNTHYDDIIGEISGFLKEAAIRATDSGVDKSKIIVDPGIGFGKSVEGNFVILKNLHEFAKLGFPILIGASRKSFLGKTLGLDISQRMEASMAAACYAVLNGADIVRVHDVAETKRALTIIEKITGAVRS
jgi:dihydropteroate synthase